MRILRVLFLFSICNPLLGQTSTPAQRDPQAVALVQAAITRMGGATAIGQTQSWSFQGQAEGRIQNGTISEDLPLSLVAGVTVNAPPPWATPRSLFVPALVSTILLKQFQDLNFSLRQEAAPSSDPTTAVAVFLLPTQTGESVPAQRWYFDTNSGLPSRIEFKLPAEIGQTQNFPGIVTLSDYRAVGGVLYPFHIVTFIRRQKATETITLLSVTPSSAAPSAGNAAVGGAL
jgi:hypothetical protein